MSKIDKKIRKAATEYYANEVANGDTTDDKAVFTDCFQSGADFALSNQWRNVEDELPPTYTEVFVSIESVFSPKFGVAWCSKKENGTLQWDTELDFLDLDFVKYWMPIPPLPEP